MLVTDVRRKNPVIWQQTDLHTAADNKFGYGSLRLLKQFFVLGAGCFLEGFCDIYSESALLLAIISKRLVNQLDIIGRIPRHQFH